MTCHTNSGTENYKTFLKSFATVCDAWLTAFKNSIGLTCVHALYEVES